MPYNRFINYHLFCDNPNCETLFNENEINILCPTVNSEYLGIKNQRDFFRFMGRCGWTNKGDNWYCPNCVENNKQKTSATDKGFEPLHGDKNGNLQIFGARETNK